jgi:hypothetical protein
MFGMHLLLQRVSSHVHVSVACIIILRPCTVDQTRGPDVLPTGLGSSKFLLGVP